MAITDHPNYNRLSTWVAEVIETIKTRQAMYFSQKGRYFQGLRTPTSKCDGETEKEIAVGLRPSDQPDSWNDFAPLSFQVGVTFPANVSISTYESPDGFGYIIRVEVEREGLGPDVYGNDGNNWVYMHNAGPEKRSGVWDEWYIEVTE